MNRPHRLGRHGAPVAGEKSEGSIERELLSFVEARAYLLEALAVELGWTFSATQREYDSTPAPH